MSPHAPPLRMLSRRRFLAWLAGGGATLAGGPLLSSCGLRPQAAGEARVYRVGYLSSSVLVNPGFAGGLGELGYVEGQNLAIETRGNPESDDQLRAFASELLALNLDCLVASGAAQARVAKEATSGTATPVVAVNFGDPVGSGLVTSLDHPGGNLTGVTANNPELDRKRLEVFKEAFPELTTTGFLYFTPAVIGGQIESVVAAGRGMGVDVRPVEVVGLPELSSALDTAAAGADGLHFSQAGGVFANNRAPILAFVARRRLPAIYMVRTFVDDGGLMSFGPNIAAMHRRAAALVDKVLRGAKPGDLPVEYGTSFELVLNLKTAQALGLTFPQSILIQATEVIR